MPSDEPPEGMLRDRELGGNPVREKANALRSRANKQCLSFPVEMLHEIELEARRLDRSVSWVVQRAWKLAREELKRTEPV
jgi:uncharacterized small protein (TIGR04563 family)